MAARADTIAKRMVASPTPTSTVLLGKGLCKTFSRPRGLFRPALETVGLDGVDITVKAGEIVGIVGESGSGKSTLAKTLIGLVRPDAGQIEVNGELVFCDGKYATPAHLWGTRIVFQDPLTSLNPRMRVGDIVAEGLNIEGRLSSSEIKEEVEIGMREVGLGADSMRKFPHQFSGGQRQRISIARALVLRPSVLVADEAVSALDVSVQMQILNLLLDLRERFNMSIVFISHDIGVIDYLTDSVLVMHRGCVVEKGSTDQVIDRPCHDYTQTLIAARPGW